MSAPFSEWLPEGMAERVLQQDVLDGVKFMADVYKAFIAEGLSPRVALELSKVMLNGALDEEPSPE